MQKQLQELKNLHTQGLISDDLYAEQQKAILATQLRYQTSEKIEAAVTKEEKQKRPFWQAFLIACIVLFCGLWIIYQISDSKGKDAINRLASETGIGTQIIPWSDRAASVLNSLIPINEQVLADGVQGITHPTGTGAKFSSYSVSKLEDRVQVEIKVDWKGGFVGGDYQTTVAWEISEGNHVSAKVISDTAMTEIANENKEALDDFFRVKVYPSFYRSMTGKS